ncbi:MAG TPA: alanine racemase [Acidimicrobiia bacterium]|nr:alanine racemase [Acidimicrobiia bacterium]
MTAPEAQVRPTWGEVDLDAIRANARQLAALAAPAALLAVVKADGYGHGAVPTARAALDAGATWLGVALVEEGAALRAAGLEAPILVLSEPPPGAAAAVVRAGLTPVVYTEPAVEALAKAVAEAAPDSPLPVHLKVDTGMHRVGCAPASVRPLVEAIAARPELALEGLCTHFAVADEPERPETAGQLAEFRRLLADLEGWTGRRPIAHAANSAALLAFPEARLDLVRVGIALYGVTPAPALADRVALVPALSVRARVTFVKTLPAGSRLSYGLRYALPAAGRVATVPVGYADGVPRNLGLAGGEVLIGGRRHPIAGAVTMDQLMVDVGDDPVDVGDEVVLLGAQGGESITAEEWAERLGTIGYEIVTGIGPRVPRRYLG